MESIEISMLEKPDLPDEKIIACLSNEYQLNAVQVAFLPLGADRNTAVYRVVSDKEISYFVKLRRGAFDETTVTVPKLLHDQGITQVIAPLPTRSQQIWTSLGDFKLTVSPFVEGHSGFEVDLSDRHWIDFGQALKGVHSAEIPPELIDRIRQETFSAQWRKIVKSFQEQVESATFGDPVAAELATFLKSKHNEISELVRRAERLASVLQAQSLQYIVCHADIHAGNILVTKNDALYIIDWDTLTFAPKERDLMFIGAGLGGGGHTAEEQETLFYRGYGQTETDPVALAYYRYERIVQDIAAYCEQLLLTDEGGKDREEGLRQFSSQFLPGGVMEMAYRSEENLPPELKSPKP
jgi:spectinomycin phosphotransferase